MISRKVRRYFDAKAAYDRYCRQREQDPTLKQSTTHTHALRIARTTWLLRLRTLTGHDLAAARAEERRRRLSATLTLKESAQGAADDAAVLR